MKRVSLLTYEATWLRERMIEPKSPSKFYGQVEIWICSGSPQVTRISIPKWCSCKVTTSLSASNSGCYYNPRTMWDIKLEFHVTSMRIGAEIRLRGRIQPDRGLPHAGATKHELLGTATEGLQREEDGWQNGGSNFSIDFTFGKLAENNRNCNHKTAACCDIIIIN